MYINNDIDYLKYLKDKKIVIWGGRTKRENKFFQNKWEIIQCYSLLR